jgi:hypothetical protein
MAAQLPCLPGRTSNKRPRGRSRPLSSATSAKQPRLHSQRAVRCLTALLRLLSSDLPQWHSVARRYVRNEEPQREAATLTASYTFGALCSQEASSMLRICDLGAHHTCGSMGSRAMPVMLHDGHATLCQAITDCPPPLRCANGLASMSTVSDDHGRKEDAQWHVFILIHWPQWRRNQIWHAQSELCCVDKICRVSPDRGGLPHVDARGAPP